MKIFHKNKKKLYIKKEGFMNKKLILLLSNKQDIIYNDENLSEIEKKVYYHLNIIASNIDISTKIMNVTIKIILFTSDNFKFLSNDEMKNIIIKIMKKYVKENRIKINKYFFKKICPDLIDIFHKNIKNLII